MIADLPSGVVTLLFSDIEGSTQLLKRTGDAYDEILEEHCELVRAVVSVHGGIELSTEGDSFFVVFSTASSGMASAVAVQCALDRHVWPAGGVVRVRMGLHTGLVRLAGRNYVGMAVHEAARIAAATHGGQIVVSEATADSGVLPDGASLRPLGIHRLKDIDDELRLFQICHPDLRSDFPALRSSGPPSGALPSFASSFVGRSSERAALAALIRQRRVITIVGPPGVGKTRLAIEVARDIAEERRAGARLVELGIVAQAGTVADEVARALGVHEQPGVSSEAALVAHLASTDALIIIDNCEHVAGEVASLVHLVVAGCPQIGLLLTSREPLEVDGELLWQLSPLSEAADLFVERATSARPGLSLRFDDPDVVAVCARVDGLPLAIELAAAQARRMSVAEIASDLADRFALLDRSSRGARPRHATLRAAIDWSYELLKPSDAALLSQLAVFAGSFDGEDAAAVAGAANVDEILGRLVDRSLVALDDGGSPRRYRVLATIRAHAGDRLDATQGRVIAETAHARHFRAAARRAAAETDEQALLAVVARDLANHRAALAWHLAHDALEGLAYAVDLDTFWSIRLDARDGADVLEAFLAVVVEPAASLRASASAILADLHRRQGRLDDARCCAEEAIAIDARAGCDRGHVSARLVLAQILAMQGQVDAATTLIEANRDDAAARGDNGEIVMSQRLLVSLAIERGDAETARSVLTQALERVSRLGDTWMMGPLLLDSADLALLDGRLDEARRLTQETLDMAQRWGETNAVAGCTRGLARIARYQDAWGEAIVLLGEAGRIYGSQADSGGVAHVLTERAIVASHQDDHELAATLLGGAAAGRARLGLATPGREVGDIEWATRRAAVELGPDAFQRSWTAGQGSTVEALLGLIGAGR